MGRSCASHSTKNSAQIGPAGHLERQANTNDGDLMWEALTGIMTGSAQATRKYCSMIAQPFRSKSNRHNTSGINGGGATPGSGLIWQGFLVHVQHFVRRKMTTFHLETTSPPEVMSRCKIAQIKQEI